MKNTTTLQMKESTIFVSGVEMTFIRKHEADTSIEITEQEMADWLKMICNADDVNVKSVKVQVFEGEAK